MWLKHTTSSDQISQEVYDVFTRMNSGEITENDKLFFEEWKECNPGSLKQYRKLEFLWDELGIYAMDMTPEEIGRYIPDNKTNLNHYLFHPITAIAVLIVLVTAVFAGLHFSPGVDLLSYQTGRGERLVLNLVDSSIIHLNSRTELKVRFTDHERSIDLISGEALFEVAHDMGRKFIVNTRHGFIQALGTEFNVNVVSDDISVTVLEGSVMIKSTVPDPVAVEPQIVAEGEQVVIEKSGNMENIAAIDVEQIIAWTRGKLIFSGEPLYIAIARVNLQSKHSITVTDPRIRELRIYGVFNMGDTTGFISALEEAFPLKPVVVSGDTTLLLYKAGG